MVDEHRVGKCPRGPVLLAEFLDCPAWQFSGPTVRLHIVVVVAVIVAVVVVVVVVVVVAVVVVVEVVGSSWVVVVVVVVVCCTVARTISQSVCEAATSKAQPLC